MPPPSYGDLSKEFSGKCLKSEMLFILKPEILYPSKGVSNRCVRINSKHEVISEILAFGNWWLLNTSNCNFISFMSSFGARSWLEKHTHIQYFRKTNFPHFNRIMSKTLGEEDEGRKMRWSKLSKWETVQERATKKTPNLWSWKKISLAMRDWKFLICLAHQKEDWDLTDCNV